MPLAVLRAISDPHNLSLPPAVEVAMAKGGGLAVGAMLGSVYPLIYRTHSHFFLFFSQ